MVKPVGKFVRLSEGRIVFVGEHADCPDCLFLGFRNSEGCVTRIMLSREAFQALMQCGNSNVICETGEFPASEPKLAWRVVSHEDKIVLEHEDAPK